MLIVQITDCHIVEPGELVADRVDSAASLRRAVAQIRALATPPDLVVATGDLVNEGRPAQYDHLETILAELDVPVVPLPGNHDDRMQLRARFDVLPTGDRDDPIDHVLDLGSMRIVFLDTQVLGSNAGRVADAQCAWVDEVLAEAPDRPTIVFQHHPPFETGIGFMDRDAFEGAVAYEAVIARHRQVELVSCGHIHRSIVRRFGGTVAATWPSTSAQLGLALGDEVVQYTTEPAAFVVHHWTPGAGVRSHLQPVGEFDRWTPAWALGEM